MILRDQNKTGLMLPAKSIAPPVVEGVRLTIPAEETLVRAGHRVERAVDGECTVTLCGRRIPRSLVARICRVPSGPGWVAYVVAVRTAEESAWPTEIAGETWALAEWLPCPRCGSPVVWYEAGYVPGYRICVRGHHHSLVVFGVENPRKKR